MKLNRSLYLLVLCTFASFAISGFAAASIRINEFVANNLNGYRDEDLEFSDWIELHNFGAQAVSLAGWHLTDDEDEPSKWAFPATATIPANGYLIVHASSKNRTTPRLHTNFGLNEEGEYLALIDNTGVVVSVFDPFPQQVLNVSYGYDSTARLVYFTAPTPGAVNGVGGELVADTRSSVTTADFMTRPSTSAFSLLLRERPSVIQPTAFRPPLPPVPFTQVRFAFPEPLRFALPPTRRAFSLRTWIHKPISSSTT